MQGCGNNHTVEVVNVYENGNCQHISKGVRVVSYADIAQLRGAQLLSLENSASTMTTSESSTSESDLLVAISRGEQSTPGYALTLGGPGILRQNTLEIPVIWQTPARDAILPQATTHPCLVVGVTRNQFDSVRILDQNGEELGVLKLN